MSQETKQVEKPEPKPLTFNGKLPAYTFYEIVKAINAVTGYGLDAKDTSEVIFQVSKKGLSVTMMDKAREVYLCAVTFVLRYKMIAQHFSIPWNLHGRV